MAGCAHACPVCTIIPSSSCTPSSQGVIAGGISSPEEIHPIDLVQDALQKQMSRSAPSICKHVRHDNENAICSFQLHLTAYVQSKGTRRALLALWVHSPHTLSKGHEFAWSFCRNDCACAISLFDPQSLESAIEKQYLAGSIEGMPEKWLLRRRSEAARPGLAKPDHTCTDTAARKCTI